MDRRQLPTGIYIERGKYKAVAYYKGHEQSKRFPIDTAIEFIEAWQARTAGELADAHADSAMADGPAPERGTFAGDLPRRLKQLEGTAQLKSDRSHLTAWLPFIGKMLRSVIRPLHVIAAMDAWKREGKSPATIRHRRRVLRELYNKLDGPHSRPPLKGVSAPKSAEPRPVPTPMEKIAAVAASLAAGQVTMKRHGPKRTLASTRVASPAKTSARFLVNATCGQRPVQIKRTAPGDVQLFDESIDVPTTDGTTVKLFGWWYVPIAKGGLAVRLPLSEEMAMAWRAFIAANAWGTFDSRSYSKTIKRHGWPHGTRPYNTRHTFGINMIQSGANLGQVQGMMGHKYPTTTRIYAGVAYESFVGAVSNRVIGIGGKK